MVLKLTDLYTKLFQKKTVQRNNTFAEYLIKISNLSLDAVFYELQSNADGLALNEAENRMEEVGKNTISRTKPPAWYSMLLNNITNPFILVLIALGIVSYLTEDMRATIVVAIMIVLSVLMRFIQEFRSSRAAEVLREMVRTKATVIRISEEKDIQHKEDIPLEELVPGDIVYLSAGDMIPADIRLIQSKDLFISQSALTGETFPVEKYTGENQPELTHTNNPLDCNNLCFMGTSVVSGFGKAIVIATGARTYFGSLATNILGHREHTSFDKGINKVTWVLIRFILVTIPIIFLINGFVKHDWKEAFLFSIAVAVGLTPEMLPMIVTANLSLGAVAMSRFKVIVKKLNSIQSLGAMTVLCTDKTGTLTQDRIILEKYIGANGIDDNLSVLEYGFLNSYFQSGLKNMLDLAILDHGKIRKELNLSEEYQKIDEVPFDFMRKRLSVIIKQKDQFLLICKGAVDELFKCCTQVEYENNIINFTEEQVESLRGLYHHLSSEGFRVIGVAYKKIPFLEMAQNKNYSTEDEKDLVFLGLMAFLDPPKETASDAIQFLKKNNVRIKVLTGDNEIITKRVCKEVGLEVKNILLGKEIETLTDRHLREKVAKTTIFAKLSPLQKARIIKILQKNGEVVGFLGDGINDAPGLREADVGISVDSATDIARESADIILLEKNLLVLGEGVIKGREVYGNIIKYIKMTTSSNFGNVFSVLIASAFLPFLPMLPLQILILNLLYDFSQLSIPWDRMDKEFLKRPKPWDPKGIGRFMLFIGPISSIFDVTTFLLLWHVYGANSIETEYLFQSGWFIESLLSQTIIVHMIRTKKIPFIQSNAAWPVILMTALVMFVGVYLTFSWLGTTVGLVEMPDSYYVWMIITLLAYCALVQLVKVWYIKRFKAWL